MRRLALLGGVLVLPMVSVGVASPAFAVTNNICVGAFVGSCDSTVATVQLALTAAGADGAGTDSVINIAPGTYADGPYFFNGSPANPLTVHGSGATTVFTLPASANNDSYVTLNGATLTDLLVQMEAAQSSNDVAVLANAGSVIDTVIIDGTVASNASGIFLTGTQVSNSSINMGTGNGSLAMRSTGGAVVTGSSLVGTSGFVAASAQSSPDTLSGLTITTTQTGVTAFGGTVSIDNSLLQLGSGNGIGLSAANGANNPTPKTINADHVTIVGGGPGSEGVRASATASGALQTSTVNLTNSIVQGPATSVAATASNNGLQGGESIATVNVSYTDYDSTSLSQGGAGSGFATIALGAGNTLADPMFAGPGDFHPVAGSPVIDAGNPAAGGAATDLEGTKRVQDGNADGIDRRDMGAYELPDTVAPNTTITGGPTGPTKDATPTFTFASDPGATYFCQVDVQAEVACTSPFTSPGVTDGAHTFRVRSIDTALNADPSPAERAFVVDTVVPTTKIVRKPGKVVSAPKAKFTFTSNDGTAKFECRVDKKAFKTCLSPAKLKVKPGKHTFYVRAVDAAGNVDTTPAKYKFTKVKKP